MNIRHLTVMGVVVLASLGVRHCRRGGGGVDRSGSGAAEAGDVEARCNSVVVITTAKALSAETEAVLVSKSRRARKCQGQYFLGLCYYFGEGVEQTKPKRKLAESWADTPWHKCNSQHNGEASSALNPKP